MMYYNTWNYCIFMAIMEINKLLRVVLDTNILVSSLIGRGASYKILERFKQNHFVLYSNANLSREYSNKLNQLIQEGLLKDPYAVSKLLNEIRLRSVHLRMPIDPPIRSTDPKDNCVLEVALVGGLNYIVTSDSRDLLSLRGSESLGKTQVITPEEFMINLNEHTKTLPQDI